MLLDPFVQLVPGQARFVTSIVFIDIDVSNCVARLCE